MKRLDQKVVFITGGLSGIGKACAMAAARQGAILAIADLPSPNSDSVLMEIKRESPTSIFIECDVAEFLQVEKAVDKVVEVFGRLDVALNNAGIGGAAAKMGDMSEEAWLKVISINFNGVFHCMKYELAQMAKQHHGVVVNMSSILGKVGFANSSHYVSAKHGVIGMTQTAALEYATEGIRVNAICPGFIETPLLEKGGISSDPVIKKQITELHPMKRMGLPEEIARGFIFLATDDSSFMTGATLDIDGGYLSW